MRESARFAWAVLGLMTLGSSARSAPIPLIPPLSNLPLKRPYPGPPLAKPPLKPLVTDDLRLVPEVAMQARTPPGRFENGTCG